MKRDSIRLATTGLAMIISLLLAGCSSQEGSTDSTESSAEKRTISVEATVVTPSDLDITKTFSGALFGEQQADIYAKLSEAVQKINISEGSSVKANQTIITLDPDGATSGIQAARSLYLNSEKNYTKMSNLYKEGAISEIEYDQAKTAYEVGKANYESLLQMIEIRSPISGVVTSVDVNVGQYVTQGYRVATVASVKKLRLTFAVNAGDVNLFAPGSPVVISSDLTPNRATGKVISTAGSADTDTRAFEVEAIIDNSEGHFRPGMFVHVDYLAESIKDAIVIDRSSIVVLEDEPVAFVIHGEEAGRVPLKLGQVMNGQQIVLSGLSAGDTLVTVGQSYLDDGSPVKVTRVNGR